MNRSQPRERLYYKHVLYCLDSPIQFPDLGCQPKALAIRRQTRRRRGTHKNHKGTRIPQSSWSEGSEGWVGPFIYKERSACPRSSSPPFLSGRGRFCGVRECIGQSLLDPLAFASALGRGTSARQDTMVWRGGWRRPPLTPPGSAMVTIPRTRCLLSQPPLAIFRRWRFIIA